MDNTFEGRKVVLKALVGSHASNLNTPASDMDWKYFVTPTFDDLYNGTMFASAQVTDTVDFDCHDVRKLGELLWKSNLNFTVVLFSPQVEHVGMDWLFANADLYAEMNLPYFFNGAMGMHREKMATLLKGTGNTQILIEKFGYDTKQAMHALRCLYIVDRMLVGLTMREAMWFENGSASRNRLLKVKRGDVPLADFKDMVQGWHDYNFDDCKAFFMDKKPDYEAKARLDAHIKEMVRANM